MCLEQLGSFACRHDFEAEVFDVVFTDATLEGPQIGVSGAQEEDVDGFEIVRNCKGFHIENSQWQDEDEDCAQNISSLEVWAAFKTT